MNDIYQRVRVLEDVLSATGFDFEAPSDKVGVLADVRTLEEAILILGSSPAGDLWVTALNDIADGRGQQLGFGAALAEKALESADVAVVAAAAQALATAQPEKALSLLPQLLKDQTNLAVRAAVRSALETAGA